jgi:hypothetical protein
VNLNRSPEFRLQEGPKKVTLVYLVHKPPGAKNQEGVFPAGTELKILLTKRKDGTYEDVYFYDEATRGMLY